MNTRGLLSNGHGRRGSANAAFVAGLAVLLFPGGYFRF